MINIAEKIMNIGCRKGSTYCRKDGKFCREI